MRLPRDVSGRQIINRLATLGSVVTRQKGPHIRLTTLVRGEHQVTIPDHDSLRGGTLRSILTAVASHRGTTVDELTERLFPTS